MEYSGATVGRMELHRQFGPAEASCGGGDLQIEGRYGEDPARGLA